MPGFPSLKNADGQVGQGEGDRFSVFRVRESDARIVQIHIRPFQSRTLANSQPRQGQQRYQVHSCPGNSRQGHVSAPYLYGCPPFADLLGWDVVFSLRNGSED